MSIGGRVIQIKEMTTRDGVHVNRLWCVDRNGTETCVFAEWRPELESPQLGENVWWQAGLIMFDQDRRTVRKIGNCHSPRDEG